MNFLEAIHHDNLTAVSQQLEENPALVNQADAQGNTPLHYAVAQQNLALIDLLIRRGAKVSAKNQQKETAAEWYEELITTSHKIEKLSYLKRAWQAVEKNDAQVIAHYLKIGCPPSLRCSRGMTLLHLAVEWQRPAIVKVILERTSPEKLDRLLKLKNSQGKTPLELAKQKLQPHTTPVAQEICTVLQEKQRTPAPGENTLISQPPPTAWPFAINQDFTNRVNELSNKLENPITVADFAALNPLREVICQLAYITCRQALAGLSKLKRRNSLKKELLHGLFGRWCADTQHEFQNKLQAIVGYLDNLIQQQQVDQVIHFSNELPNTHGWHCLEEKIIYLNPTGEKTYVIALVVVLIHEATHVTNQSHDFATMPRAIDSKGYTIDFDPAFYLASIGLNEKSTPEQVKLFELRQLLQEGKSPNWRQQLYHWMALNNADTQTVAIVALATLPEKYAQFDDDQQTLFINPQFLSVEYLTQHPAPLPLTGPCPPPLPEPQGVAAHTASVDRSGSSPTELTKKRSFSFLVDSFNNLNKQQVTTPCSPEQAPSHTSVSTACVALSPPLEQSMAALTSSAGQPELPHTEPAKKSPLSFFSNLNPFKKPEEQRMTSPCSPKGAPSEASVSTTACSSLSTQVQQTMAATTSSADPSGLANTWSNPNLIDSALNRITRRDNSP